jgi:hypothetical protein
LANYDDVQKKKKLKIAQLNKMVQNNPDLQKSIDEYCQKYQLSFEDREILLIILARSSGIIEEEVWPFVKREMTK